MFRSRHTIPRLLIATAFLGAAAAVFAQDAEMPSTRPAEYMVYQYPGVSLVVVIDARETEFESRISGPEGVRVSETALAARRIGPVYQFVEAVATPRQLMIEVNPARRIERSRISMEMLQLPDSDHNARRLARAYRYLAHGMKRVHTDSTGTWAERSISLRNAAQAFASMGMEEMRLWSEYYAAHLVLYQIGDSLAGLERSREIGAAAHRAGFEEVELAASLLEADALMLAGGKLSGQRADERYEQAHAVFEHVAGMALAQGFQAEHGRALYNDGLAYERQGRLDRAIERYRQALDATAGAEDPDLLNTIRATAAAAYERRGSTSGAISLLDEIAGDLSGGGEAAAALELARNLHEKGRLLNASYRFAEAAETLEQALALEREHRDGGQWGLVGLTLGRSRYEQGYLDEARAVISESLPRTPPSERQARAEANGLLAEIARARGRFDEMSRYRETQGRLITADAGRAAQTLEAAMDARARDGAGSRAALGLLARAQALAAGTDFLTARRAVLHRCLLELERGSGADCTQAAEAHAALESSGLPAVAVDAGMVWAEILQRQGRPADALSQAARVADAVQFYRDELPGALSAWSWRRGDAFYRLYMGLVRAMPGDPDDGTALLLALERMRQLERSGGAGPGRTDAVRSLLARLAAAQPMPGDELSRQAARELAAFRERSGWSGAALDRAALDERLASLGRRDTVLTYHFTAADVEAVLADRKQVRRIRLGNAGRVRDELERARRSLADPGGDDPDALLDSLGRQLLGPLPGLPQGRVYLLSSGPLLGFPFDALRLDGAYLAETHRVINLDSLTAMSGPDTRVPPDLGERVFLAGNPRAGRDLFSYGVSTSPEIEAVRDRFVGDGLHIVQGVALRGDEFNDARYGNARLVHLAMPGRVDLAFPERSRLLLSGERETPGAEFLQSGTLSSIPLRARLAVLSQATFAGSPGYDGESRVGLVKDLHAAGARLVLCSLWATKEDEAAAFMTAFYRQLGQAEDVSEALFQTRVALAGSKNRTNLRSWAGFQLFIR